MFRPKSVGGHVNYQHPSWLCSQFEDDDVERVANCEGGTATMSLALLQDSASCRCSTRTSKQCQGRCSQS
eukprot:2049102-Amphidinium_carterae.1